MQFTLKVYYKLYKEIKNFKIRNFFYTLIDEKELKEKKIYKKCIYYLKTL